MNRTLKVLSTCMAVLALTAVAASSASAFTNFKAEAASGQITGTQLEAAEFTAGGATIVCKVGMFNGMITSTSTPEQSTSNGTTGEGIEYGECFFLGIKVTVKSGGCQFNFHAAGTVDVTGEAGSACLTRKVAEEAPGHGEGGITWEAAGCKIRVKLQNGINNIGYANENAATERSVLISPTSNNVQYYSQGCIINGDKTTGVYAHGKTTVEGFTSTGSGTRRGIWIE